MLNSLLRFFTGREIILYTRHRQTLPLINTETKKKYFFAEYTLLWKLTFPFGRNSSLRYRVMALFLYIVSPKYILDVNWIMKYHILFYVWCKKSGNSKYVVVQHGIYAAGIITEISHRFTKCDVMLCWSDYFKEVLSGYNQGKKTKFYVIGNPVYNQYDRSNFEYKKDIGNKILIAISPMGGERLKKLTEFKNNLEKMNFVVNIKEHPLQSIMEKPLTGFNKITGDLYSILTSDEYDIVMCDTSTSLLDAIFFKKYVMFFSPENTTIHYTDNIYSKHLRNFASEYKSVVTKQDLQSKLNISDQENLFNQLVSPGVNNLNMLN
jgi:hypothetical protein